MGLRQQAVGSRQIDGFKMSEPEFATPWPERSFESVPPEMQLLPWEGVGRTGQENHPPAHHLLGTTRLRRNSALAMWPVQSHLPMEPMLPSSTWGLLGHQGLGSEHWGGGLETVPRQMPHSDMNTRHCWPILHHSSIFFSNS